MILSYECFGWFFFFQAEDGIRDPLVTGVQTCALPILLGLVGVDRPMTMKGRDLTHDAGGRAVILATRPPLSQVGIRAGSWKLVHWNETGASELFDLATDPDERNDVSKRRADVVVALVPLTRRWQVHSAYLIVYYAAVLLNGGRA